MYPSFEDKFEYSLTQEPTILLTNNKVIIQSLSLQTPTPVNKSL